MDDRRGRVGAPVVRVDVGEGPPVVLVHGLAGSARWWERNIPALAREHHVYAVDLPGFGANRAATPGEHVRFDLRAASRQLKSWMDDAGIARADVIGHSMGGGIAADLAAEHPDAVDHLVLVDAAVLPPGTRLTRSAAGLARSMRYTAPDFLPVLAQDALRAGPRTILDVARQIHTADLRPKLGRIHAPTLVIWGDHDEIVPLDVAEAITRTIPHATLRVIEGAGHIPMWDRPDEFNRLVLEFLRDGLV